MYIILEGIDGCGKTTQSNLLTKYLKTVGRLVTQTKEPGSSLLSFNVRNLLLDENSKIDPKTRQLLFEADRCEHTLLLSKLKEEGLDIVCDRSFLSGLAYGICNGLSYKDISNLMKFSVNLFPDHIFLLEIDKDKAFEHRMTRSENVTFEEKKGSEHLNLVQQNMLKLIDLLGIPFTIIKSEDSIENIHSKIVTDIQKYL